VPHFALGRNDEREVDAACILDAQSVAVPVVRCERIAERLTVSQARQRVNDIEVVDLAARRGRGLGCRARREPESDYDQEGTQNGLLFSRPTRRGHYGGQSRRRRRNGQDRGAWGRPATAGSAALSQRPSTSAA